MADANYLEVVIAKVHKSKEIKTWKKSQFQVLILI